MIEAECHWITKRLDGIKQNSILDIGGGSHYHRFQVQPYIAYELYRPLLLQKNRLAVFEQGLIQRKKDILFSVPLEVLSRFVCSFPPLQYGMASFLPLVRTIFGDCQCISLPEESYDGIFVLSLLEHVTDPEKVLSGVARILRKGGFAFVSVPEVYQYHPAPIDTGLRMTPEELTSLVKPYLTVCDADSLSEGLNCRVSILYCKKK